MVVLMVILTFIIFIGIGYMLERRKKLAVTDKVAPGGQEVERPYGRVFIHPSHTYAKVVEKNLVEVGMDDFAMHAFGNITATELPCEGDHFIQGDVAWRLMVGKRTVTQRMPLDGFVQEVNPVAFGTESWILKVQPIRLEENLANLIQSSAVMKWIKGTRAKFLLRFSGDLVPAMQDGGELVFGFSKYLSDEQWTEFCRDFFNDACDELAEEKA